MSIVSVDNIQPIGSGTSVTVNSAATLVLNNVNSTGVVTATTFSGSGASLTNLPAANLTGTLPAISGANLTSLPSQVTISNNADNRIITGGSGTNLVGESLLTFDGNKLLVASDSYNILELRADENNDGGNDDTIIQFTHDGTLRAEIRYDESSSRLELSTADNRNDLVIDSSGNVEISDGNLILANGHGIDFSATGNAGNSATMANELLDDYEEGSWSPTGSWTTITARYTKIGRMVYAGFSLRANTSSGNVTIGGFPFTSANNHAASGGIAWGLCEFNSSGGWLNGSIADGSTSATIRRNNATVLTFGSGQDNMNQNAFLRGTFIYHTA